MPSDLPTYAIPFLLSTYKFGIFIVRNVFNLKKWDVLVKAGYLEYVSGYEPKNIMVLLTDKGADFVEQYALAILVNYSPYYTYPIVKTGDTIDITADTIGYGQNGMVQLVNFDKGSNIIHDIDHNSIFMSHENTPTRTVRIYMKPTKDYIKFATEIKYTNREFDSRIGKIILKIILDKTDGLFNGIVIADLLDKLYTKDYAKNRITEHERKN